MKAAVGPEVSVVVPTFNRMDTLPQVIVALAAQEQAPPFEVVVVDDGSDGETRAWLEDPPVALPLRTIFQRNKGPAAARNLGVRAARADMVALLGDDTVPSPGWLARLVDSQRRAGRDGEAAVIGRTSWHPRMHVTPFLHYINEQGAQFGFALIEDPRDVPFNFFYSSNVCLRREPLLQEAFDESFPYAAWEDTELGYRLRSRGLRICYEPEARVWHDHPTDLARFCARQEKAGYAAVVFYRLHPALGPMLGLDPGGPPPRLGLAWRLMDLLARSLQGLPVRAPALWDEVLRGHYVEGLHRGWSELRDRS